MREQLPDYGRIIAEDNTTLKKMQAEASARMPQPESQPKEWRTIIVGLPIIRRLLNGDDVTLDSFRIALIPDDVLFNNRPRIKSDEEISSKEK